MEVRPDTSGTESPITFQLGVRSVSKFLGGGDGVCVYTSHGLCMFIKAFTDVVGVAEVGL